MSKADCLAALEQFAPRVDRFCETSSPGPFVGATSWGQEAMGRGQINVCFLVKGGFGVAEDIFEAIRVLSGKKLPRLT